MTEIYCFSDRELAFQEIARTFKDSFGRELDEQYWSWRFRQNPYLTDGASIYYAMDGNRLAAYYAASPVKITFDDRSCMMALSNMTMTHPDYRGKGLFVELARKLYAKLADEGFVGVAGFANHNSHYGFRKHLGWRDIQAMSAFRLAPEHFRYSSFARFNGYEFEDRAIELQDADLLASLLVTSQKIKFSREAPYLRWRLADNPENKYRGIWVTHSGELMGCMVYKHYMGAIDVLECFYAPTAAPNLMVLCINSLYSQQAQQTVNCWVNLHTDEHVILEKAGFVEVDFNAYFGVVPFTDDLNLDYRDWHVRFMDSDIY